MMPLPFQSFWRTSEVTGWPPASALEAGPEGARGEGRARGTVAGAANLVGHPVQRDADIFLRLDLVGADEEALLATHEQSGEAGQHQSEARHRHEHLGEGEPTVAETLPHEAALETAHGRFVTSVDASTRRSFPPLPPTGLTGR